MALYQSVAARQPGRVLSGGRHTVTSAEATANQAVVNTGLHTIESLHVMIRRADKILTGPIGDATVTVASGVVTVADGTPSTGYNMTTGDVIDWLAYGKNRER